MPQPRILSVGQCAFDHNSISKHLTRGLKAQVTPANTFDEALARLRSERFALVLVNRVTDADDTSGLDLIRTLKSDPALAATPVMLVSDVSQAQADAEALGALPGIGKSRISDPKTLERIATAVGGST